MHEVREARQARREGPAPPDPRRQPRQCTGAPVSVETWRGLRPVPRPAPARSPATTEARRSAAATCRNRCRRRSRPGHRLRPAACAALGGELPDAPRGVPVSLATAVARAALGLGQRRLISFELGLGCGERGARRSGSRRRWRSLRAGARSSPSASSRRRCSCSSRWVKSLMRRLSAESCASPSATAPVTCAQLGLAFLEIRARDASRRAASSAISASLAVVSSISARFGIEPRAPLRRRPAASCCARAVSVSLSWSCCCRPAELGGDALFLAAEIGVARWSGAAARPGLGFGLAQSGQGGRRPPPAGWRRWRRVRSAR